MFYAAHNGIAAVYDERGEPVPFGTAAEALQHGDVTKTRPHNYYLAQRMSAPPYIVAKDRHGRVMAQTCRTRDGRVVVVSRDPKTDGSGD